MRDDLKKLILSAMFLALCMVLPFLTMHIPQIGAMLSPMHIPVLLCGFVCGTPYGAAIGFIAPLLRSAIIGMPPLVPTALAMSYELAAYGALTGVFFKLLPRDTVWLYVSLVLSQLLGRVIWGLASFVIIGIRGDTFTFGMFMTGAFVNAVPAIVLQLLLIPPLVLALGKAKLLPPVVEASDEAPYVLVSACLLGIKCRYDGNAIDYELPEALKRAARIVPFCPEVYSGLPTPRPAVEIRDGRAITDLGPDCTQAFEDGAQTAVELAKKLNCAYALLKERSPSCGSGTIHAGNFDGTLTHGDGFAAKALKAAGVKVFGDSEVDKLLSEIRKDRSA